MTPDVYTIGLAKIEVGDIGVDGGMGTALAALGYTLQNTCKITQEDARTNEFFAEEKDDPVVRVSQRGKTTVEFSLMNPDLTILEKLLGGKVEGTGATQKWTAPAKLPIIEKSVKITPKQGLIWAFPRLNIEAKIEGNFSRENIFVIAIKGIAMEPTKVNEPIYSASLLPTA